MNDIMRWTYVNNMEINKAKFKVLNLSRGNPKQKHRLGREKRESSPKEKGPEGVGGSVTKHELRKYTYSPESQLCPGLCQSKHSWHVRGGMCPLLFCSTETLPGVPHPHLGFIT